MKTVIKNQILFISVVSLLLSCKPQFEPPVPGKGSIDVTRFVALGSSITAGFTNNALYYDGQVTSYSNLLADQFKLIGGGEFRQPLLDPGSIGVGLTNNAPSKLGYKTDCLGVSSISPITIATSGDINVFTTNIFSTRGPFNNCGVPGMKVIEAVKSGFGNASNGIGNYNPFFSRMVSNPTTASILSDAAIINPTFFSILLGMDDVLEFAMSGGTKNVISPSFGSSGIGFDESFNTIISTLTANGAKGVIGNIPEITSLPYFTTIAFNALKLDSSKAAQITNAYSFIDTTLKFYEGNNAFIIADTSQPFGIRQIREGEFILLKVPLDSIKCNNMGSLLAIPDKYVLTTNEIVKIESAINTYNVKIKSLALTNGLAFVDVNAFFKNIRSGIVYNGIDLNANFVSGGTFSLDGIRLTPIGNALLANEFIKAINNTYGSTIPQVDASKYRGNVFP